MTTKRPRNQHISAAFGLAALITAFGVTVAHPQQPAPADAHAKFDVITVMAQPSATAPATVTETNKPHQLQVTKATPQVYPPRTVIATP